MTTVEEGEVMGEGSVSEALINPDAAKPTPLARLRGWLAAQVEALKKVEGSPFFEDMRAATVRYLYNNPDVWRHFGYQGPSAHLGGYIKRGFDDISWIPDDEAIDA